MHRTGEVSAPTPQCLDLCDRSGENDACAIAQHRRQLLHSEERALHVDDEHLVIRLFCRRLERGKGCSTGVDEQGIDGAEFPLHTFSQRSQFGQRRHIPPERLPRPYRVARALRPALPEATCDDYGSSTVYQQLCRCESYPAAATRDEDMLAAAPTHVCCVLLSSPAVSIEGSR
jgi:hypothetical protein